MNSLSDFLTRLGDEPELRDAYANDPAGTMEAAGLPHESVELMLGQDLEKIKQAVQEELGTLGGHFICFMVVGPAGGASAS